MSSSDTQPRTLWTQVLLEDLVSALTSRREDGEVRQILRDLDAKGLPPRYVLNKVRDQLSPPATMRLRGLLGSASSPAPASALVNPMRRRSPHRWRLGLWFRRLIRR